MKGKILKGFLVSLLLLLYPSSCMFGFSYNGLEYSFSGAGLTVTGLTASYSGELVIPKTATYDGVTLLVLYIDESAFSGELLSKVTIPSTILEIGDKAFANCEMLKTLILEDGEEDLAIGNSYVNIGGDYSTPFTDCPIETLYLGRNLSYSCIWTPSLSPFRDVSTLKSVTIGENVTSIGLSLFYGCSNLVDITSLNLEPPTCQDAYAFNGVPKNTCVLTVPLGSKNLYSSANYWNEFTNIEEEPIDGNIEEDDLFINYEGISANTENIVSNVSFKMDYSIVNTSYTLTFTGPLRFGLCDKEGYIKEWIIDPITLPSSITPNNSPSSYGNTCLITSEIEDGDRIRLYYQDPETEVWKLITGITTTIQWEIVLGEDAESSMNPIYGNTRESYMKLYDYGLDCTTSDIVLNERFYISFKVLNTSSTSHNGKYRFGLCNSEGYIIDWISPSFNTANYYSSGIQPNYWFSSSEWCLINKYEDGDRIRMFYKENTSDTWKLLAPYNDNVVWEIVLGDNTGVTNAIVDTQAEELYRYTSDGKRIDAPQKGINIIKYSDGTVKKVLVK